MSTQDSTLTSYIYKNNCSDTKATRMVQEPLKLVIKNKSCIFEKYDPTLTQVPVVIIDNICKCQWCDIEQVINLYRQYGYVCVKVE